MRDVTGALRGMLVVALFWPAVAEPTIGSIQKHFRWRNDNGDEKTATWIAGCIRVAARMSWYRVTP